MGVSNKITGLLNLTVFLCAILIIAAGVWFASKPDNACIHQFRWPVVVLGVLVLGASLAGFVGACYNKKGLLLAYLVLMAVLVLLLLVLLVFAFVVMRPDGAVAVPGRAYKEYRLAGFSSWLRTQVVGSGNWNRIRTCLAQSQVCTDLNRDLVDANQFFATATISPIQSGCCTPPSICGYTYVTPITWTNPTNQGADPDCLVWNNDPSLMCYGCNSCKAGLLGNLRHDWKTANIILVVAVVVLIWVYLIGCCAFRNAQTEALFRRYKQGWT